MTDFQNPRMVKTNGIDMAVHEAGHEAGDGLPVVFCHGFPELGYSWRHQLQALAEAGYHAIAPDQRGYGGTSSPPNVEDFDMVHLTGDLCGLLDALGYDKAVFVGHDWGGSVVWNMATMHPDRVSGVVGVNTPHYPRSPVDPIAMMKEVFGEKMYIVQFQEPKRPEALLEKDVDRVFRMMMRTADMNIDQLVEAEGGQPEFDIFATLDSDDWEDSGGAFLTPEEHRHFVTTFERTGFRGGINWYRNFTRNWELSEGVDSNIAMPSLMIMAENDVVLPPSAADGMEEICADLEKVLIKGSGHWTQQEKPHQVSKALIDWLDRKVAPGAR